MAKGACPIGPVILHQKPYQWLIDSSPPGTAYMRRWTKAALFRAMACRQFGKCCLQKGGHFVQGKMS